MIAPKRLIVVWALALVTLGSGVVNLYSVIGPALPERTAILREFFPLEFLNLAQSFTLLIGFALVISSINIFKRKKRAYKAVLLLALFSIAFHLTKGLDYEEATFAAVLAILLVLSRSQFTVKSSLASLSETAWRLGVAAIIAVSYGVIGLWLLEPREFGINFTMGDAFHRTLLLLSLVGDPQLIPHTRYAAWFLNSLYLITITAIVYCGFAVFRPVLYRFRTHPHEIALATEICRKHGRSSTDFFKLWPDKSYYFSRSHRCFLAYRVAKNNFAVVLGDPVGPEDEIEETIRGFRELCRENDWRLGFHQVMRDFLPIYRRLGFKKLKIGDDAIVELKSFTLSGKAVQSLRTAVNKLEKAGVTVRYYEPPIEDEVIEQIREVSDEWLQIEGRRERQFTLGMFETNYIRSTKVLCAMSQDASVLGFVNIIPSYRKGEASIDLMRRRQDAPNGVMDYLFVKLSARVKHFETPGMGIY